MNSEKNVKKVDIYTISKAGSLPEKNADNRKKFWHIDKEMLRFKIHYFLITGTFGTCLPYITILAQKRIGISASAQAAIFTSQRVIFLFAKPAIGYIADYFKKLKVIISILAVIASVFLFAILAVPKFDDVLEKDTHNKTDFSRVRYEFSYSQAYVMCEFNQSNNLLSVQLPSHNEFNKKSVDRSQTINLLSNFLNHCSENRIDGPHNHTMNTSSTESCTEVLEQKLGDLILSSNSFFCKICCKSSERCQIVDSTNAKAKNNKFSFEKNNKSDFQRYQFWLYALLATICQGSANSLYTLTDTACCESVQKTGAQFGRQCLWGAVGWGVMCPIGGLLNDYTGDFVASCILMGIMTIIALLNITKLEIINPVFSSNLLKDVRTVLASKEFLAFMLCVVMNGVGIAIAWFYLVLFLTDIGGSRFLCGMVVFFQNFVGGIPFMFFSGWVIKKIGHFNVLTLSLLAYSIRFFCYSQLSNPWFVLPVEVLHGFNEGFMYPCIASYAKLSAKPGTEATTQALLFTAHESIGIGIGCVVTGIGFDSIGGHRTFLYLSIYAVCAMVMSIILHLLMKKKHRNMNVTPYEKT